MKKLIYLVLTVLITSCSSDGNSDQTNDPLIGEWNAYRSEENNGAGTWDVSTYSYTHNVLADGTFIGSDGCTGVWENTGNTPFNYKFYYNCSQDEELVEAIFYCNNNIIRFTDDDTIGYVYGYMKKSDYNPNNCNEVEYFGN